MSGQSVRASFKCVRPVMSLDRCEAHRRVIGLYKAFYRNFGYILKYYDIPKTENDLRWKLREHIYKNACVTDIRIIDILVIKGYMELRELTHRWMQKGHVMDYWKPTAEPVPTGFVAKFLQGVD